MKKNTLKKLLSALLAAALLLSLAACANNSSSAASAEGKKKVYKVGICNYVDDASLNQIVDNIQAQLKASDLEVEVQYDNCNADAAVLEQIIQNFIANKVDLMVGVATPVAMAMQAATEDNKIPVVFAAVSDPLGVGLVESLEKPGANITGSSDYLDTNAVMNLILALKPDAQAVGLLYDPGQDASTAPIAAAKEFLQSKGIQVLEYTGTTTDEVVMAAQAAAVDGPAALFTPTDNTIMAAELSIYENLANAKVPHFTGADSFALNGAFVGYGVDYANLGKETGKMVTEILKGADPAETAVLTFDNGTATVNTETCAALGLDFDTVKAAFEPYCTAVNTITTAESFDDLK